MNGARSGLWDPHYLEWGERMLKKSKPRGRSRDRKSGVLPTKSGQQIKRQEQRVRPKRQGQLRNDK